jgi:hypothetical protein
VALDLTKERGVPLDRQLFTWRELAGIPFSKLDADAFTRVRVILMNGIEAESLRCKHMAARYSERLRLPLAEMRRTEQHQQTMVNWLNPADQSPLETTIGFEQVAIEVTAHVAQNEPDPYLAAGYRFGLLEDFDHMYRFSALMDRVEGKDANNILQSYTDILPGRPTAVEHRHPYDDVRRPYQKGTAHPLSKLNAMTLVAGETMTHDYYMVIGPQFADPVARMLYAEIASIEEQHVTHYESFADPEETMLEKLLLMEATEVWNYWACSQTEENPRIKAIWERFLDYELGHLQVMKDLIKDLEQRDPEELLPAELPDPISFESQREYVREVLEREVDLRANGTEYVPLDDDPERSIERRRHLNSEGSPSEIVAQGYRWLPGGELSDRASMLADTYEPSATAK